MASVREKTLSYRRAQWMADDGKERDLEKLLRKARAKLTTVADRKFPRPGGQFIKAIWLESAANGGCFLHIADETPGDQASTLALADEGADRHGVGVTSPPAGTEFMDGDAILYVRGNHVCICPTNLRDGAITEFCRRLFAKAGLGVGATQFDLQKIANTDKIKMIESQGVKEIDLRTSLYDASIKYMDRKYKMSGVLNDIGEFFDTLFAKDKVPLDDNINVSLVLKADSRRKGKVVGERKMKMLAETVIGDDAAYVIVTGANQRITNDEVTIREKVKVTRYGKSVDFQSACDALERFFLGLKRSGVTEQ